VGFRVAVSARDLTSHRPDGTQTLRERNGQAEIALVLTYFVGTQTNERSGDGLPAGLTVSVDLVAFRHEGMSGKSPTLSAPVPLPATRIRISATGIFHCLSAS
jgi:hypothetical protein